MGWRGRRESSGSLPREVLEFAACAEAANSDSRRNLKLHVSMGLAGGEMKEEASRVEVKSCAHRDLFFLVLLLVDRAGTKISLL